MKALHERSGSEAGEQPAVHGSPIECYGSMSRLLRGERDRAREMRPPLATASGTSTRASASPESRSALPDPPRRGSGSDVQGQERRRCGKLCP